MEVEEVQQLVWNKLQEKLKDPHQGQGTFLQVRCLNAHYSM